MGRSPRWIVAALFALAWSSSAARVAQAQERDPVAADALFREGREAAKKGDFAAACPKFAESFRLDPTPGALLNLADCEEKTGKVATAWLHYQKLAEMLPPGDDRAGFVDGRVKALAKKLPKIVVKLADDAPKGTIVKRDGVVLGEASLGDALPLDPGKHTIVVIAKGHADRTYEINVEEAEQRELDVDVGPAKSKETAEALPPKETAPKSEGGSAAGPVLLAAGGAGVVVGLLTGAMVFSKKSTYDAHCDAQHACDATGLDAASSGKTLSAVSTVSFVAGAALAAAGLYFVLASNDAGASSHVAAAPIDHGLGASWRGTF